MLPAAVGGAGDGHAGVTARPLGEPHPGDPRSLLRLGGTGPTRPALLAATEPGGNPAQD